MSSTHYTRVCNAVDDVASTSMIYGPASYRVPVSAMAYLSGSVRRTNMGVTCRRGVKRWCTSAPHTATAGAAPSTIMPTCAPAEYRHLKNARPVTGRYDKVRETN